MLTNGSAKTNVSSINDAQLAPFDASPPRRTPSGETKIFTINQTGIVSWVVNGSPYSEAKTPIVYGPSSDGWNASTTIHLPSNATVDIIMRIANDSMDLVRPCARCVSSACRSMLLLLFPANVGRLTTQWETDGTPDASSRTQVLAPWLWLWRFPVPDSGRSTAIHD